MSNPYATSLPASPDLAQQRKRAKDLLKSVRAGDSDAIARLRYSHPRLANAPEPELHAAKLHDAQWVIAREYGFSSWLKLKQHIDEIITGANRRPYRIFDTNIQYYRDRAGGLRSVLSTGERNALRLVREFHPGFANASDAEIQAANVTQQDAELIQAREHGFSSWAELEAAVDALKADSSKEPFRLAFEAIEARDDAKLGTLLKQHRSLAKASGTNGNQLLHFAVNHDNPRLVTLLLEAGADPDAANDKGATPLTQAAYCGEAQIIEQLLAKGASIDAEAYGDGGTPLAFALFWGHKEAAEKLAEIAVVPRNLRMAAGLGQLDIMAELFDSDRKLKAEASFHREFHRPHSGFPPWRPKDDPQEILDEALTYAARSGRVEAMAFLHAHGANFDAEPYNGTALAWAARCDRTEAIAWLLNHGADVNKRCGFGGSTDGTPLHYAAAWNPRLAAAQLLVARGADLQAKDEAYQATPAGWAEHFGNKEIHGFLVAAASEQERSAT
ncbi:MAG TPA: ankyrin repeat domain-containing protein [Alphaproteobacteria bacterium]|nr:ankyrin repeat domain-containing protein [Alphaproteobacteria bacterium]